MHITKSFTGVARLKVTVRYSVLLIFESENKSLPLKTRLFTMFSSLNFFWCIFKLAMHWFASYNRTLVVCKYIYDPNYIFASLKDIR